MSLTRQVAAFVATAASDRMPPPCRELARRGFIDCIAVMIAGRGEDAVRILASALPVDTGATEASLQLSDRRTSALTAALINGTAAHVLDYDDTSPSGHRSAVLVPAILAEGEAIGATGAAMLTAYVVGFEVWSELARRVPGPLHERGPLSALSHPEPPDLGAPCRLGDEWRIARMVSASRGTRSATAAIGRSTRSWVCARHTGSRHRRS